MSAAPVVSVVLRTYDHAPFIAQAIESVLIQQAPFPFELVIGEDCSSDGTREVVLSYAERNPDVIHAVLPEQNLGHGEILTRALDAARGDLIAYLDGDDYWTSAEKLRRQVEYLEHHPECTSCFHDVSLIYDDAGIPSGTVSPGFAEGSFALDDIVMECFVPAPAMMFRRDLLRTLPGWAFESAWIDWVLHIAAARLGPLGYLPQPLAAYRVHAGGMFSALDRVSQLEEDLRFYEQLLSELPDRRELIERCVAYRGCQLAIERLGVPFEDCVVLVDPRGELRPYFNGRHARNLPRREGREVTELEAIRRAAADLPMAVRDYGGPAEPQEGGGGCYVVAPAAARRWLEGSQLGGYLDRHGGVVAHGDWGDVHMLSPLEQDGDPRRRSTRRVEVRLRDPRPDGLLGGHLEAPTGGISLSAHAVPVSGWVLGRDEAVIAIELRVDGELAWRAPVDLDRPDIVAAFPAVEAGRSGFRTTFNACDLPEGCTAEVFAVLAGGEGLSFAELRFSGG
jgi:Glycosyl transferase family 2